jgi:hypothetical protein
MLGVGGLNMLFTMYPAANHLAMVAASKPACTANASVVIPGGGD